MKKLLISSAVVCVVVTLFSCSGGAGSKDAMLNHYKTVYMLSMTHGDYLNAENAMYQEWALDTANAYSYRDTLANLYYKSGQYVPAVILGKEILAKKPYDMAMMEMVGAADQNINNFGEALNINQMIYSKTHDLYHLYQIAIIQFDLTRMAECNQTIDQVLADTGSVHQKIQIVVSQGQAQNVPYKAAVLNLRGVIAKGLKQNDTAKRAFNDALAVDPDFILAKNNLQSLK
jgi:tetratricopeptide (TPR) repeat protein